MSWYVSSKNSVKARKPHNCDLCGERIGIGESHDTRSGVSDGDGWSTMRMHPECHRYEQHGRRTDWKGDLVRVVDPEWYEDISSPAFERREAHRYEEFQLG